MEKGSDNSKNVVRDHIDPTADTAIRNVERDKKAHDLIEEIFAMCRNAGFHVEGRIILIHNRSGCRYK